jgi:hypothetical protein
VRPAAFPRWRDVQFVDFDPAPEPAPPPPAPVAPIPIAAVVAAPLRIPANSNIRLAEPKPAVENQQPAFPRAPDVAPKPRAPRYGRAIAPLPPHLIASVPPPPRMSLAPAEVTLRPAAPTLGKSAAMQGTPFAHRRGGRSLRVAALALIVVTGAVIIDQSDFVAGLAARIGMVPPRATAAIAAPLATPIPAAAHTATPPAATPPPAPAPSSEPSRPAATAEPPPLSVAASRPAASPPAPDRVTALTAEARTGDTGAQYDLGVIYAKGDGVAQDYARAVSWFREAAISGNVAAQYNLAIAYAQGHGTPQDMVAAARWYRRAAEQGVVAAMVNFAILCESGQGTDKSPEVAYAWYHAAATRGDEAAAKRADELYRQFSADDKKAADAAVTAAINAIREALLPPPGKSAAAKPAQAPG